MISLTDSLSLNCNQQWIIQDPDVNITRADGPEKLFKVCLDMVPFLQEENRSEPLCLTFSSIDTIGIKSLVVKTNARFIELCSLEKVIDGQGPRYIKTSRGSIAEKLEDLDIDLFAHSLDINLTNGFMIRFASLKPTNARTCVLFGLELTCEVLPVNQSTISTAAPMATPPPFPNRPALPMMFSQFLLPPGSRPNVPFPPSFLLAPTQPSSQGGGPSPPR
ncbi:hypothetical protein EON65_52350, partial [archaeon]